MRTPHFKRLGYKRLYDDSAKPLGYDYEIREGVLKTVSYHALNGRFKIRLGGRISAKGDLGLHKGQGFGSFINSGFMGLVQRWGYGGILMFNVTSMFANACLSRGDTRDMTSPLLPILPVLPAL